MALGFRDFLNVDYAPGMPDLIKKNAKKRKMDIPTGNTGESVEPTDEALTVAQRRARARQMKKYAARIKMGREKASKRVADTARLQKRARKAARNFLLKKLTKGIPRSDLTPARKAEIEKRLDKMRPTIAKIQKRLLPKLRKQEISRKRG